MNYIKFLELAATITAYGFLIVYMTWFFFLAIMALKVAKDEGKLTDRNMEFAWPFLIIGVILDFLTNIIMSLVFFELPQWQNKEFLLTNRCGRHLHDAEDTRGRRIATWLCRHWLDAFQQGSHCN
jgi:hypothetical protein